MEKVLKKLHSESGASMLMALLLMFVGIMVSAVIIAAAVSASTSIRGDRAQQQAYLTVSSAAEMIRDELLNCECGYTTTVTKSYTSEKNRTNDSNGTVTANSTDGYTGEAFGVIVKEAKEYVDTYGFKYSEEYTISAGELDTVTATVTMEKNADDNTYNLTVKFFGGEKPNQCRMDLTAKGTINASGQQDTKQDGYYDRVWNGRRYEWKYVAASYLRTTTTTFSWSNIEIQRKEAS